MFLEWLSLWCSLDCSLKVKLWRAIAKFSLVNHFRSCSIIEQTTSGHGETIYSCSSLPPTLQTTNWSTNIMISGGKESYVLGDFVHFEIHSIAPQYKHFVNKRHRWSILIKLRIQRHRLVLVTCNQSDPEHTNPRNTIVRSPNRRKFQQSILQLTKSCPKYIKLKKVVLKTDARLENPCNGDSTSIQSNEFNAVSVDVKETEVGVSRSFFSHLLFGW